MQSLKDYEYDYHEVDSILNRYLKKYGISYTESAVVDEQSQTNKDTLATTPTGSALRPSQLNTVRGNDIGLLHDAVYSGENDNKQENSSIVMQDAIDDAAQFDLIDLEDQSYTAKSKIISDLKGDAKGLISHEPSISTLTRDIDALEQRVLGGLKLDDNHLNDPESTDGKMETAIKLDDLDDALTLSENINESLSQHTRARAKLQANLINYNRHINTANILANAHKHPRPMHSLSKQSCYSKGKNSALCLDSDKSEIVPQRRISSSLPDISLQTPKTLTRSAASNPSYTPRSKSQQKSRSSSQYLNTILNDSILDYPFELSNKLVGVSRALDTNDAISTVVINGKLTSIETRTLLGKIHTMELLLDQSTHTIGELRRENTRLKRIIRSKVASTQKILTLEAEITALRKTLKQSEESRQRQALLIENLKDECNT